jgi:hypothetical protein
MANRQAFQNYLTTLGFPADLRAAIVAQGLDNVTNFFGMTDDDVEDLCANIRKPGGVTPNPWNADEQDAPPFIVDPGVAVGRMYQERLKQIAFFYSYLVTVNRTFIANQAGVEELVRLWKYKKNMVDILKNKKDGEDDYPEKFTNSRPPREIIESIENWIGEHYGIENIPLQYVIREDPEVPRIADDPLPLGRPSYNEELIRRASHDGEAWAANNGKVWQMIRHVTHGTDAWAFVKAHSRNQDGRAAYVALKAHYMGADFVNKVKLSADAALETLHWTGKAKNFTWDKFISRLTSAFADLAENGEPKTDAEKVRRLLRAITDPTLNVAKAVVQGDPRYAEDFLAAAAYLAGQLSAAESIQAGRRNISQVTTGNDNAGRGRGRSQGRGYRGGPGGRALGNRGGGRGRTGGKGRGGRGGSFSQSGHLISNGGYPYAVWSTFTEAEKSRVYQLRDQKNEADVRRTAAITTNPAPQPQATEANRTNEPNENRGIGALMTRRSS